MRPLGGISPAARLGSGKLGITTSAVLYADRRDGYADGDDSENRYRIKQDGVPKIKFSGGFHLCISFNPYPRFHLGDIGNLGNFCHGRPPGTRNANGDHANENNNPESRHEMLVPGSALMWKEVLVGQEGDDSSDVDDLEGPEWFIIEVDDGMRYHQKKKRVPSANE
ncbi:hypothetical protein MMC15_000100 [Xylographa vitiligo]|nr:hypothetical protein [Xylographa vitiligo]